MTQPPIEELIDALRREIDALPEDDAIARDRLEAIVGELDRRLESASEESRQGLLRAVRDGIEALETRHPDATAVLNNIMMTLANMGI